MYFLHLAFKTSHCVCSFSVSFVQAQSQITFLSSFLPWRARPVSWLQPSICWEILQLTSSLDLFWTQNPCIQLPADICPCLADNTNLTCSMPGSQSPLTPHTLLKFSLIQGKGNFVLQVAQAKPIDFLLSLPSHLPTNYLGSTFKIFLESNTSLSSTVTPWRIVASSLFPLPPPLALFSSFSAEQPVILWKLKSDSVICSSSPRTFQSQFQKGA